MNLLQDARFALRVLWKNRAFTLVAMLSLAIGIGANSAVFSFADALLSSNENDLSLPPQCRLQAVLQLREWLISANQSDARGIRRDRRHEAVNFAADPDKPVATLRHCLDEGRSLRIVSQSLSNMEELALYDLRLNFGLGPYRVE